MQELTENPLPPKVINYEDYHRFLRDFYQYKKAQNPRFSFRKFAQLAGIKSSNYLMLVMDHKRRLSPETAVAVARAMKLSKAESNCFVALVKLELARTQEERDQADKEKKVATKKIVSKDLPSEKAEYLSTWYYSLVRELAFLPDFVPNANWIAHKLGGMITVTEAESAFKTLVNLGFWRITNGKVEVCDIFLDTGPEERTFGEIAVTRIHQQNLLAWCKMLDKVPKEERELGLIHIPINGAKLPELKSRIQRFQDEIIGWLQAEDNPTQIVQLGTYLVPVTEK